MVQYLHTNNANSNLAQSISAAATTIRVSTGYGTLFPNPTVDQAFFVTVEDRRLGKLEIMRCTARSGDTLTVVRGQQGTVPQSFTAGVNVSNRVTAQVLNEFVAATIDEISIHRLPSIPDWKLVNVNANRLFGSIAAALLPNIPSAKLTSVPAASLTGTIASARLPSIPATLLPEIPASKITSVPAVSLTGSINADRLPNIPVGKLPNVPAGNLSGTVPNAAISGSYHNFVHVTGSGNASFNRYIASSVGTATAPSYTWAGYGNTGIFYYPPGKQVATTVAGQTRFSVSDTAVIAHSGTVLTGHGGGLHSIGISALGEGGPERDWVGRRMSEMEQWRVGSINFAFDAVDRATAYYGTRPGSDLRPCSADVLSFHTGGLPGTWRCLGTTSSGGGNDRRATLWQRVE